MNPSASILIALLLAALLPVCVFGFMATYEPMDRNVQLTWRIVYTTVGVLCVAGFAALIVAARRRGKP
jgi:hypothetical protein